MGNLCSFARRALGNVVLAVARVATTVLPEPKAPQDPWDPDDPDEVYYDPSPPEGW